MQAEMKPYYDDGQVTIWHSRWQDVAERLDPAVIVTDPPYGTGGWRRTDTGAGRDPSGTLVVEPWDDGALDWFRFFAPRVRAVLTFWPTARTSLLLNAANDVGLTKHRCLYLRKPDPKPQVQGRIAWSVEPIWVLSREHFQLYGGTDVWDATTPRLGRDTDATGHPYQKPLSLMRWLLGKVRAPSICDPFAGSGTTLRAAKDMGLRCVGIEEDERWCEVTARRLAQGAFPLIAPAPTSPGTPPSPSPESSALSSPLLPVPCGQASLPLELSPR